MKKNSLIFLLALIMILSAGCNSKHSTIIQSTKVITDMGGRQVTIPQSINKVFCSNPIGTVDIYTLAPDKLSGWNFVPTGASTQYIDARYLQLPALGVWMGAGAVPNQEEISKVAPDIIFCFWTCDKAGIDMADTIQQQTKLPVILMDYSITATPEVYRRLGTYLDEKERGEKLASYCEEMLEKLDKSVASIPDNARKSVFLSEGTNGLQTDPVGSLHVQDALDLLKLLNVADLPGTSGKGMGMPSVSWEQLLLWQPDAIIVSEYSMGDKTQSNIYEAITSGKEWSNLEAVKSHSVYRIPQVPFSWFGKPPSSVRLLGCMWLFDQLYPNNSLINLRQETSDFYSLFYRIDLTKTQLDKFLANNTQS